MTTLSTLNTFTSLVRMNNSRGMKIGKSVVNASFKVFGSSDNAQEWVGGVTQDFVDLAETLSICVTADEINEAYRDIGSSCMKKQPVGVFYSMIGVECWTIEGARALVNTSNNMFYRIYGENHYVLRVLLLAMGKKENPRWLSNKAQLINSIKKQITLVEEDFSDYLFHVLENCTYPGIEDLVEEAFQTIEDDIAHGVVETTIENFVDILEESTVLDEVTGEYTTLNYSSYWKPFPKTALYVPSMDGYFN